MVFHKPWTVTILQQSTTIKNLGLKSPDVVVQEHGHFQLPRSEGVSGLFRWSPGELDETPDPRAARLWCTSVPLSKAGKDWQHRTCVYWRMIVPIIQTRKVWRPEKPVNLHQLVNRGESFLRLGREIGLGRNDVKRETQLAWQLETAVSSHHDVRWFQSQVRDRCRLLQYCYHSWFVENHFLRH